MPCLRPVSTTTPGRASPAPTSHAIDAPRRAAAADGQARLPFRPTMARNEARGRTGLPGSRTDRIMSGATSPSGDDPSERHLLEYAGPTRRPSGAPLGQHVLAACNVLVGVVSLGFVPLAEHIYSCTEGQKWCHFQALVFGIPAAMAVIVLGALTAAITPRRRGLARRHPDFLMIIAWLPLTFAAGVLVALFVAVVHNS